VNTADGMPTVSDLPIEILALPAVLAVVNPPAKNCGHMPSRKAGSTTKRVEQSCRHSKPCTLIDAKG